MTFHYHAGGTPLLEEIIKTHPHNVTYFVDFDDCLDKSTVRALNDEQKQIAENLLSEFQSLLSLEGYGEIKTEIKTLEKFYEALDLNQPFAFVGKPCDISAIRLLSKTDSRVNKLCKFLLTLVCGGFAEFTKAQDFIESFKVKEDELSIFRYRGYGNPGRMYIKTKDGREYDREYNSFWGEESTWRVPFRCKICPDAIGESSDVAALDTWRGGSPKGEDEGFNAAIVRTKKGLDLMNDAAKAGFIHIGDKLKIADISDFQPHQVNKKKAVYARHQGMKKNNSPTINTRGLRIEELSKLNSNEFNQKEESGVTSRIKKIK